MADNCPHVPVDMLHGWRMFARGHDWDVGGEAVVDHDERPEWDECDWTGGDCEMWNTAEGGWMLTTPAIDRTGWPAEWSQWVPIVRDWKTSEVEWSACRRRWRLLSRDADESVGDWTAGPIDLNEWRAR